MQHQEMIHPSEFGLISRICIFSLAAMLSVFAFI